MGFLTDLGRTNALAEQSKAISNLALNIRQGERQDQQWEDTRAIREVNLNKAKFELEQQQLQAQENKKHYSLNQMFGGYSPETQQLVFDKARQLGFAEKDDTTGDFFITGLHMPAARQWLTSNEGINFQIGLEQSEMKSLTQRKNDIQKLLDASDPVTRAGISEENMNAKPLNATDKQNLQAELATIDPRITAHKNSETQLKASLKPESLDQLAAQKAQEAGLNFDQIMKGKAQASQKPIDLGDYRESKALELYKDRFVNLNPDQQKRVNDLTEEYNVRIAREQAGARTKGTIEANLDEPIPIKDISNYFDPKTLQPIPKGTTGRQAQNMGAVYLSNEEIKNVGNMQKARAEFEQLGIQADRLLTATTSSDALIQGTALYGKSFLPNTAAKVYSDTKNGYLGALSKAYAGETGVLTDRDIQRIGQAMPGFSDTVASKDAKMAILRAIAKTAERGAMAKIGGIGFNQESFNADIQPLITALDNINGQQPSAQNNANKPPLLKNTMIELSDNELAKIKEPFGQRVEKYMKEGKSVQEAIDQASKDYKIIKQNGKFYRTK